MSCESVCVLDIPVCSRWAWTAEFPSTWATTHAQATRGPHFFPLVQRTRTRSQPVSVVGFLCAWMPTGPRGSVASRLFPRNRDVFRPPLKPLCPVSLAVDLPPHFALSSPLFISRRQPAGVRAVRRLTDAPHQPHCIEMSTASINKRTNRLFKVHHVAKKCDVSSLQYFGRILMTFKVTFISYVCYVCVISVLRLEVFGGRLDHLKIILNSGSKLFQNVPPTCSTN